MRVLSNWTLSPDTFRQLGVTIFADTVRVRALHKNDTATIYISKLDMLDQSQFADNSLGMSGESFQIATMN